MLNLLLFIFGLIWFIEFLLSLVTILKSLLQSSNTSYKPGTWALVTGSTDGIGKGFAIVLAKKGMNIVQVSRNPSKLESLASDLYSKYGIQVKNIVKDFSLCTNDPIKFYTDIYEQTKGLDIRIVVNNVGINIIKSFKDTTVADVHSMLAINAFPLVFMSKMYAKDISAKNGAFINLSSVMAEVILRKTMLYNATKAFDLVFSEILASEGLTSLCLQPGYVNTPLTASRKTRPLLIEADECAESALNKLNVVSRTSGHWKHILTILLIQVSSSILEPIIQLIRQF